MIRIVIMIKEKINVKVTEIASPLTPAPSAAAERNDDKSERK